MIRRTFVRTMGLTAMGGIFVPRYERWFRPIVAPREQWWLELWAYLGDVHQQIASIPCRLDGSTLTAAAIIPPELGRETIHARVVSGRHRTNEQLAFATRGETLSRIDITGAYHPGYHGRLFTMRAEVRGAVAPALTLYRSEP